MDPEYQNPLNAISHTPIIIRDYGFVAEETNNGIISLTKTGTVGAGFVGITTVNPDDLEDLYALRDSIEGNEWVPNFLPPRNYPGYQKGKVIVVECDNNIPIDQIPNSDLFIKCIVDYINGTIPDEKFLYPTLKTSKFFWTAMNTVGLFIGSWFRPVLDPKHIIMANNGNAIFTKFEKKPSPKISRLQEAIKLSSFFKGFMSKERCGSCECYDTPKKEIDELCSELESTKFFDPNPPKRSILPGYKMEDALCCGFMWTPEIRSEYMLQLGQAVENRKSIYSALTKDAFKVDQIVEWYNAVSNSSNNMMKSLMKAGDNYYDLKKQFADLNNTDQPLLMRMSSRLIYSVEFNIDTGVIRVRDAMVHVADQVYQTELVRAAMIVFLVASEVGSIMACRLCRFNRFSFQSVLIN